MNVDKKTLQIVFDIAVGSLDFGSGFLDNEDVRALRSLARHLGVDPDKATPENWRPWDDDEYRTSAEIADEKQIEWADEQALLASKGDTVARENLSRMRRVTGSERVRLHAAHLLKKHSLERF